MLQADKSNTGVIQYNEAELFHNIQYEILNIDYRSNQVYIIE